MKKVLSVLAVLVAAAFLASCCRLFHKEPCGHRHGAGMAKCDQCPKAAGCECKDGKCPKCGVECKGAACAECAKKAECACGKGAECKCVDCKCPGCAAKKAAAGCAQCPQGGADTKEMQHGPVGAPEGAPAK